MQNYLAYDCAETEGSQSIIRDMLHMQFSHISPEIRISFLSCFKIVENWIIEFGSERILRYSSIGVQNIIFEFKIMIYE